MFQKVKIVLGFDGGWDEHTEAVDGSHNNLQPN